MAPPSAPPRPDGDGARVDLARSSRLRAEPKWMESIWSPTPDSRWFYADKNNVVRRALGQISHT